MEISVKQSNQLKVLAIFMMLGLHLFNINFEGNYTPVLFVGGQPLIFYVSYFFDICVPVFAFVSGYGLYSKYAKDRKSYPSENKERLKKLYLNLWVIILIFPIITGSILQTPRMPGSMAELLLNLTAIKVSYSPIWWYFTTYVLLVITSPFLFYVVAKYKTSLVFLVSLVVYCIAYYYRIFKTEIFTNELLHWLHAQGARYGLVQFEFLLGAFALHQKWNTKFTKFFDRLPNKQIFVFVLLIVLVFSRSLVPSMFVAPFCSLFFIALFNQIRIAKSIGKFLDFFSPHATNIWLVHSFFYLAFFREFILSAKYPLFIFVLLLICSLISSYIVNFIYNKLIKLI